MDLLNRLKQDLIYDLYLVLERKYCLNEVFLLKLNTGETTEASISSYYMLPRIAMLKTKTKLKKFNNLKLYI